MPIIDLFNKSADEIKMAAAISDGSFRFRSKLYAKYMTKCVAEGLVIGTVATLATVGALVAVSAALTPAEETE